MPALIGLLGGTFDPPHHGHLAVARDLCRRLDADCVRFLLNAVPPHRAVPHCSTHHRLAMLEAALAGEARLLADARELERRGPSYTLWTLRSLRQEFADAGLFWIIGADAWLGLHKWHRWYELSALVHMVVVERPGWPLPTAAARRMSRDAAVLRQGTAGAILCCEGPGVDVSATAVRRRIAAGEDVSDAVPAAVLEYIRQHGLYGHR